MARRVMSIWLPRLPLDRRARLEDPRIATVFAITSQIKNAPRLTHLTDRAHAMGLYPGMSVPDARALCPDLLTEPGDPLREDMLLRAVRRWADQLSPWIALDRPDGLLLDVSGCAHLFGGEMAMARHSLARFADMQIMAKIGIADTKRAARALARHAHIQAQTQAHIQAQAQPQAQPQAQHNDAAISIAKPGKTRDALDALPVEALDVEARITTDLRRVGLKTLGQIYTIKQAELARRFGIEMVTALSKMLGQFPDPVSPMRIDPVFAARMNLPDPIGLKSDLTLVLEKLSSSVCERLKRAKMGARHFQLTVRCVDTGDHVIPVRFAWPCFETRKVVRQFERPLDDLKIEFGADWFRLVADMIDPIRDQQGVIDSPINGGRMNSDAISSGGINNEANEDLAQVITTLGNRLGFDRVRKFIPRQSHHPEYEFTTIEAADSKALTEWPTPTRRRPLRLFKPERLQTLEPGRPPKRFKWRKTQYTTQDFTGPERLSSEWWQDGTDTVKDYWAIETQDGARLWLLTYPRQAAPDWFVTGQFL